MNALLTRFVPNLIPGLGALLNPWVLLTLLGALVGAFLYGMHVQSGRLEAFQAKVTAAGDAQDARTMQRIKDSKRVKKEVEDDHKKRLAAANARANALITRLRDDPGGSVLPTIPVTAASPDRTSFDRPELDRALRDFTAEVAELIRESDAAITGLDTAKKWVAEEGKLQKESAPAR